jgi:hypothetical protein
MKWQDPMNDDERRELSENIWYAVLLGGSFVGLMVYIIWLVTR